jgi:hypothetical protein
MLYNQTIKFEDEHFEISNDKYFNLNRRTAFLAIDLIGIGFGAFLINKWSSLNEFEIFLCGFILILGVTGLVKEIFFKSYRRTIPFGKIKKIKKQYSIFNRQKIRIWLTNGKFQDLYTNVYNGDVVLSLKEKL